MEYRKGVRLSRLLAIKVVELHSSVICVNRHKVEMAAEVSRVGMQKGIVYFTENRLNRI